MNHDLYQPDSHSSDSHGADEEPGTLYTPPKPQEPEEEPGTFSELALCLQKHILLPASMIAMVSALLFYLVDLRSIFLPYGSALKWLGFCFITATVLIARYGKLSGNSDMQGIYTGALTAATLVVILVSPWDRGNEQPLGRVLNGLILLAAWYYAGRVTRDLSPEGIPKKSERGKIKLYGLERLRYEAWERKQGKKPDSSHVRTKNVHARGNRAVIPLIFGVLVLFALCEPLILMGPPEVGLSALGSVILFLLGAAMVLATGTSTHRLEQVRHRGGRGSEAFMAVRTLLAGGLTLVILAAALTFPGVRFQGTGELQPQREAGESDSSRSSDQGEESGEESSGEGEESGDQGEPAADSPAMQAIGSLAALGAWLKWPLILLALLGGLYLLHRVLPLLGGLSGFLQKIRDFLARLRARFPARAKKAKQRRRIDPWADLPQLRGMDPRDTILGAYGCLMLACAEVDRPRDSEATPYEFITRLAGPWQPLRGAASKLTDLYVRAAYGSDEPAPQEAQQALALLDQMRPAWEKIYAERTANEERRAGK